MNQANEESHNNYSLMFHYTNSSSFPTSSLTLLYQTASEELASSLSHPRKIKPSRPLPPIPSIPNCTEAECPPPGKNSHKKNVSENGSTNIVQL
ncbi:hypothetical protein O181_028109 [Austropuccinia psidii MF-1]|uniref:Uncharacterized protein n=1 Tax=Austropuccinia psidii MF-1 TaxID=1389203 RepID=A0A9Q3H391_9BASI|nr:hypothetical protein [Austropuccinia psidii MF-1]